MVILRTGSYFLFFILELVHIQEAHALCYERGSDMQLVVGHQIRSMGTCLDNESRWCHCKNGQPRGKHLQYRASFDRGQVVILAADGFQ